MKKHIGVVLVALAIVLILLLYSVSFTVRWREKALVLTFGKIVAVETEPGLKWKWPWPIQEAMKFDCRIRTLQQRAKETATRDKQTIIATIYINWRIDDPKVFYERFRRGGAAQADDVIFAAERYLNDWISDAASVFTEYNLGQLVTLNPQEFKLAEVEKGPDPATGAPGGMLQRIRDKAAAEGGYGIEIVDLGIRRLGVPDLVTQSVFERMKEDRGAVELTRIAEGDSQAKSIKGKAKGEATMIKANAEALAKKIEGQGDAEAAQYYTQFLADPDLADFLRQLETLRNTLSERTTIILDNKSAPYSLLTNGPQISSGSKGIISTTPDQIMSE